GRNILRRVYSNYARRDLARPGRADPARPAPTVVRAGSAGQRACRRDRAASADRLEAPARPARGRAGPCHRRRATPDLPARPPPVPLARRLARTVPAPLERPARSAGAPSRRNGRPRPAEGAVMIDATEYGTYIEYDGRPAVRFVRTYPHPIERVWHAITDGA